MLPCYECAHRRTIPGDAHTRCNFDWREKPASEVPVGDSHGVTMGWFTFPTNFDPVWGPDDCVGYLKKGA